MSFWTAVVIIVAIWGVVSVIRTRHNSALGYGTGEEGRLVGNPQTEGELKAEIERLHRRLEVLERIATDAESSQARERRQLEAEIDSLRERE